MKGNFLLFYQNIRYPKRYSLKLRYFQRPLFLLKIKRFIYKLNNAKYLNINKKNTVNELFKYGISSYYDKDLATTIDQISKDISYVNEEWDEDTFGYLSKKVPERYLNDILPKLTFIADYYLGGKGKALVRGNPKLTFISSETVKDSKKKTSSTDFWHIDTPNQLTMHIFFDSVDKSTPHLAYCTKLQNKNFIDLYHLFNSKKVFNIYRNLFPHQIKYAFGNKGNISIFDPNGLHQDLIPKESSKARLYIHINFTPGNY